MATRPVTPSSSSRREGACTGDLFNGYIGYMGDAYVDEWAATLGRLAELDFRVVIAGHGAPFERKGGHPTRSSLHAGPLASGREVQGRRPLGRSRSRVDLTAHASRFPQLATSGFAPLAVERIYAVIDERSAEAAAK